MNVTSAEIYVHMELTQIQGLVRGIVRKAAFSLFAKVVE